MQFFQGRRGWGGGSVSTYSTCMNGRKLPEKLCPDIFLWFPRKTQEDGWSQMTDIQNTTHTHTHTPLETAWKNIFIYRPKVDDI